MSVLVQKYLIVSQAFCRIHSVSNMQPEGLNAVQWPGDGWSIDKADSKCIYRSLPKKSQVQQDQNVDLARTPWTHQRISWISWGEQMKLAGSRLPFYIQIYQCRKVQGRTGSLLLLFTLLPMWRVTWWSGGEAGECGDVQICWKTTSRFTTSEYSTSPKDPRAKNSERLMENLSTTTAIVMQ